MFLVCVGCVWGVCGDVCGRVLGVCVGCVWDVCGMCVGCVWERVWEVCGRVCGMCVGCVWDVCGRCVGESEGGGWERVWDGVCDTHVGAYESTEQLVWRLLSEQKKVMARVIVRSGRVTYLM